MVDCWNQLPDEVVAVVSTNSFKAKLDRCFCKQKVNFIKYLVIYFTKLQIVKAIEHLSQ